MSKKKSRDQRLEGLIAGRTVGEQLEYVSKYKAHGLPTVLRHNLLQGLGVPKPKKEAENLILFGCYIPFSYPSVVTDYIKLLDLLSIDFTYLEDETCCGNPMIVTSDMEDRESVIKACKEFVQLNRTRAQQMGATNLVYCCVGCLDLIINKLEDITLKTTPTTVGYFEGCHVKYLDNFPGGDLNWSRYRHLLDRVDGLTIVDLPNNICCKDNPGYTAELARQRKVDTVICPCNGCYYRVGVAGAGKGIQTKHFIEVVSQILGQK
jgi:Fe-S oxidoreductase